MLYADKFRRLSILLVSDDIPEKDGLVTIGKAKPDLNDPAFIDYVELLSASNISFDIITPGDISPDIFIHGDMVKYVTVILTVPLSNLSDSQLSVIRKVSYETGISLIASYDQADERSISFFGIRRLKGKRHLWPLKVKIVNWPLNLYNGETVVSYGLSAGLPGIRKRGLGKLDIKQTLLKMLGLCKSLYIPFTKVELHPDVSILATNMRNEPVVWSYKFGNATNYYFSLHSGLFLDKFNEMHKLVRSAIEANSGFGMVSAEIENTMVLRLDDPGACSTAYLDTGNILEEEDWENIGNFLRAKKISMSVMYTPEWVDNGDRKAGKLFIDNKEIEERQTGAIYDSALVRYVPLNGKNRSYDHQSEFRGLKKYSDEGLMDIHSHGLTHLVPDYENWPKSGLKNKDSQWYHEFFHVMNNEKVDKNKQLYAMCISKEKIRSLFGVTASVLAPSGHRHDDDCDLLAYKSDYRMLSSDYTSIFKQNMIIRNWKIPGIFLYLKDPSQFSLKSGYPFIGIIHDYEIKEGMEGFQNIIDDWIENGIKKFISLNDLISLLCAEIQVVYAEKESKIEILIDLNGNAEEDPSPKELTNYKFSLRFVFPRNVKLAEESVSLSEGSLDSMTTNNSVTTVNLTLKNKSITSLNIPVRIKE